MGFDLGSFIGGVVGSLGAYFSARYTIKKQYEKEKPKINKTTYIVASQLSSELNSITWKLVSRLDDNPYELMGEVIHFQLEINKLIPDAFESDLEVLKIIQGINQEIQDYNNHIWPNENERTQFVYVEKTNFILHKYKNECDKILERLQKEAS